LNERRSPADLPPGLEGGMTDELGTQGVNPLLRAQLERAGRQLATLHGAISRVLGAGRAGEEAKEREGAPETAGVAG